MWMDGWVIGGVHSIHFWLLAIVFSRLPDPVEKSGGMPAGGWKDFALAEIPSSQPRSLREFAGGSQTAASRPMDPRGERAGGRERAHPRRISPCAWWVSNGS